MGSSTSAALEGGLLLAALLVTLGASAAGAVLSAVGLPRAMVLAPQLGRGSKTVLARWEASRLSLVYAVVVSSLVLGLVGARLAASLPGPFAVWAIVGAVATLGLLLVARLTALHDPEESLSLAIPIAAATELLFRPMLFPAWRLLRSREHGDPELAGLLARSTNVGPRDEARRELLSSVIEFSEVRAREIMVPRPQVVAVSSDATQRDVARVLVDSGYSRLPVYEGSIDNVVGVLLAKTLFVELIGNDHPAPFRLRAHLKPPFFVPETMQASRLLAEFQRRRTQLAVVVDEFGGTSGIVTLEDVVEQLVGDLRDETDVDEGPTLRELSPGVILADGSVSIREVEDFVEQCFPGVVFAFPEDGPYETLGGFITTQLGTLPSAGEELRHGGMLFIVRGADEKRVSRVELRREASDAAARTLLEAESEPGGPSS